MNDPLQLPLTVYRRVAALTVLLPIPLYALTPVTRLFWLEAAFLWHWLSIAWLSRQRTRWSLQRVATGFCLVEWSAALAITAVEGWAIHLTPIMCLGPVVLAIQVVDEVRHRRLILAAIVLISAMAFLSRLEGSGPIREAAGATTVDVVAIIATPLLAGIVALLAWLNQGVMTERKDLLLRSRMRLYRADESARASFADFSNRMQALINEIRGRLSVDADGATLTALTTEIQGVTDEIRTTAHGLGIRTFDVSDRDDVMELVSEWPWPVEVVVASLDSRDPVVDSVARAVIHDAFTRAGSPTSSTVTINEDDTNLSVEVVHSSTEPTGRTGPSMLTADRVDAIGGTLRTAGSDGSRVQLTALLPLEQPADQVTSGSSTDLRRDLRSGRSCPAWRWRVRSSCGRPPCATARCSGSSYSSHCCSRCRVPWR